MKEFKIWNWGYVPIALALALVWYEFWRSGTAPPPSPPPETQAAATIPADATEPAPPPAVIAQAPAPDIIRPDPPRPSPPAPAPAPANQKFDERLFTEPPPISFTANDVNPTEMVRQLNAALGGTSITASGLLTPRLNVDVANKSFWDVFQSLQDQAPFEVVENAQNILYQWVGNPAVGANVGIRHFQRHGPAIVYARQLNMSHTINPQAPDVAVPGSITLTLGTVIDPRLKVTKHAPIVLLDAVDEGGHALTLPVQPVGDNMVTRPGNAWTQSIAWPAPAASPKKITLHCEVRFAAPTEMLTTTLEDAQSHVGEEIAVGDMHFRLIDCSFNNGTQLQVRLSQTSGPPAANTIGFVVQDATGRTFGNPANPSLSSTFAAAGIQGPFKLTLQGQGALKEVAYQFELADIPIP